MGKAVTTNLGMIVANLSVNRPCCGRIPRMADMQGGILLSSDICFFQPLEVDITVSYRLLGPVHSHEMTGCLVKIGPTGVYFDVKRKDPLARGDMIDVHLHISPCCGVLESSGTLLTIGRILSCKSLGIKTDIYGCRSYRIHTRFCRQPRLLC